MYLSQITLKKIFLILIGLAIVLGLFAVYFYFPTIVNKLGLNKTPSKEVQQLLTDYNMTQTPERYIEMDKEVARMAVSSPSLDITNCTPYPRMTKIDVKKTLKITNPDSIDHTLTMIGKTFKVKSRSTREILLNFVESTPNAIPYNCDTLDAFVGILFVIGK